MSPRNDVRKRSFSDRVAREGETPCRRLITSLIFPLMRDFARRLLFLLCAVAFFTGATVGLAVHGASANEPCVEHQLDDGHAGHHHDHDANGNCLTCCIGVCVAIPDLPPPCCSAIAPLTVAKVGYWDRSLGIAGRTIQPDPTPPIPSA